MIVQKIYILYLNCYYSNDLHILHILSLSMYFYILHLDISFTIIFYMLSIIVSLFGIAHLYLSLSLEVFIYHQECHDLILKIYLNYELEVTSKSDKP